MLEKEREREREREREIEMYIYGSFLYFGANVVIQVLFYRQSFLIRQIIKECN